MFIVDHLWEARNIDLIEKQLLLLYSLFNFDLVALELFVKKFVKDSIPTIPISALNGMDVGEITGMWGLST